MFRGMLVFKVINYVGVGADLRTWKGLFSVEIFFFV